MEASHIPYRLASQYLQDKLLHAGLPNPTVGIICGSGLSGLSKSFDADTTLTLNYAEIPGFPRFCSVKGHKGEVIFGFLSGVPTICFRGRFHSYEGHSMKTVVLPVNVMRCLGVQLCIITNAAGGLNSEYNVGDIVAVSDHLSIPQLAGNNPLIGSNDDELGPRFPPTSNAYDDELRRIVSQSAATLGYSFVRSHGTYCFVSGPMYESKAECHFLRMLGGDLVGMSTVPEIVTAHHCGMKPLCLSLVTNVVVTNGVKSASIASHEDVLEAVQRRASDMQALVQQIVHFVKSDYLPKLSPLPQVSLYVPSS